MITDETFPLIAAKHYDNPQCYDLEEFHTDLKRFQYLKRLFKKYRDYGELRERLILNHIIITYNVFGEKSTELLFYKLVDFHSYLKPFLVMLGYLPEYVKVNGRLLITSDIPMDEHIVKVLRSL